MSDRLTLRGYQERGCAEIFTALDHTQRVVAVAPTGSGKCLGRDVPVLCYDGTIKAVQDVQPDDLLMGPDSTPRRVLSTCEGVGPLHRIVPVKGDPWICNAEHILTVVHTETSEVTDVSLQDWLKASKWYRHLHKQFSVGVNFASADPLPVDPYFFGLWLGDGTKLVTTLGLHGIGITKPDTEVERCVRDTAAQWDLEVSCSTNASRCPTWHITRGRSSKKPNTLLHAMRELVGYQITVPTSYITASRADRLQLLAGWLDSDGHLANGNFEIAQKRVDHADAFMRLARSLGFRVTNRIKYVNGQAYQRMMVSGDLSQIPNRIPRKIAGPRRQIKDACRTGFTVEPAGEGPYYGFVLDGDGRFLLGDYTVTHNTVVAGHIIDVTVKRGKRCLFLAHRKELIDQISALLDFAGIPHGVIMAGHWRYRPDEPIQVASIDSLMSMRACPSCKGLPELIRTCNVCGGAGAERSRPLPPAEFIVIDEAHRAMGAQYQALIAFYPSAQILLITATPWRLDGKGLGTIVKKMIVVADMRELIAQKHLLPIRLFRAEDEPNLNGLAIRHGDYKTDELAGVMRQSKLIGNVVDHYIELANKERAIAFATNVAHSLDLTERFIQAGIAAEHLDGTMTKTKREQILARFKSGETRVVSNCDVLVEGVDIPSLHCVILARPTKSITRYLQQVGRAMRPFKGQEYCLVIDHAGCRREHGRPDDFREWSLEDRRVTGRAKEKTVSEPEACPQCGLDLVRKICARCSPQLFSVMFTETDDRLVEDQPAQQTEIALHEPDRTGKKSPRVQRAKHGMALCNRCRETWVSVPAGKVVKVTCHKCLQQENRT